MIPASSVCRRPAVSVSPAFRAPASVVAAAAAAAAFNDDDDDDNDDTFIAPCVLLLMSFAAVNRLLPIATFENFRTTFSAHSSFALCPTLRQRYPYLTRSGRLAIVSGQCLAWRRMWSEAASGGGTAAKRYQHPALSKSAHTRRRTAAAALLLIGKKRVHTIASDQRNRSCESNCSKVDGSDAANVYTSSVGVCKVADQLYSNSEQPPEPQVSQSLRDLLKQDPPDTRRIVDIFASGTADGSVSPRDIAWAIAELDPCDVPQLYRALCESGLSFSAAGYSQFLTFAAKAQNVDLTRSLYYDIVECWHAVNDLTANLPTHWEESSFYFAAMQSGDRERLRWATARLVNENPQVLSPRLIRRLLDNCLGNADLQSAIRLYEVLVAEGIRLSATSYSHFLRVASRFRNPEFANKLLVDVEYFGLETDTHMMNSALSASRREDTEHAVWMAKFAKRDVQPSISTVTILLQQLLAKPGFHPEVFEFVEQVVASTNVDLIFFSAVIDYLNRNGRIADAAVMLNVMKKRKIIPDASIYGSMVSGYMALNQPAKAEPILKEMIDTGLVPDIYFFAKLIAGCLRANDYHAALRVLDQIPSPARGPSRSGRKSARVRRHQTHIMGVFLKHCARTNDPDLATRFLRDVHSRGFQPDRKVYTQLIYIFRYDFGIVQRLWAEMNAKRSRGSRGGGGDDTARAAAAALRPDAFAFRNYLEAIVLSTGDLGRVRRAFYEMRRAGIKHTAAVCDVLVWAFGCGFDSRIGRDNADGNAVDPSADCDGESHDNDSRSNSLPRGGSSYGGSDGVKLPPRTRDLAASRAAVLDFLAAELDIRPTVYAMNQLLRALVNRPGSLAAARACFLDIERRTGGHRPNAHSYAAVIRAAARAGQWETVAQFAGAARRDGVVLLTLTQASVERAKRVVGDHKIWAQWEAGLADEMDGATGTGDGWDTVRDLAQFLIQPPAAVAAKAAKEDKGSQTIPPLGQNDKVFAPWPPDMAPRKDVPDNPARPDNPLRRDNPQRRLTARRLSATRWPGFDGKPPER
ncbi:Pentatricopeptide repeat-containing protein 1, mitochondrial [Geranomyces michiganensis]|nr:Pentatricopeptide repeat-containing protein 1, mitochondrial [Geranomyces michiganensis]